MDSPTVRIPAAGTPALSATWLAESAEWDWNVFIPQMEFKSQNYFLFH